MIPGSRGCPASIVPAAIKFPSYYSPTSILPWVAICLLKGKELRSLGDLVCHNVFPLRYFLLNGLFVVIFHYFSFLFIISALHPLSSWFLKFKPQLPQIKALGIAMKLSRSPVAMPAPIGWWA